MNIFYYSGLDPLNPAGLRYDGSLYQGSHGLCSPASANPLVSSNPVIAAPYGPPPPAGGRALDLVVAPSTVLSLLAPQVQSTNFCASATYRMKTPYMIWPKLFRSRDRVDKSVRCELCDMVLNSEQQARQHFNGKHHLRRMRKLKLNSSAAGEKCPTDLKRSCCKTDSTGKKIRLKKRHGNRNDEAADESIATGVPSNGDPAADEETALRDEEMAGSPTPIARTDAVHMLRLENAEASKDRTIPVNFGGLINVESSEKRTNALDLDKLKNDDSVEELAPTSSNEFSHSNNESSSTNSCSSSSHTNYALAQSSCQAAACSSSLCTAPNHRCSLLENAGVSTPSASCYSSPLLHDVLSQSSFQSSHMTSSVSSSFKMATGHSMTTSRDNDILSVSATPFVSGSLMPRP